MISAAIKPWPSGAAAKGRLTVAPLLVLMLAQVGTSGDSGAMSIVGAALEQGLGSTMADIQLANVVYPLVAGSCMVASGLVGTVWGFDRMLRLGCAIACAAEAITAFAPSMAVFTWAGRALMGVGGACLVPATLGLVPVYYQGGPRKVAYGCIGAAAGIATVVPVVLGEVLAHGGLTAMYLALSGYFAVLLALALHLPAQVRPDRRLRIDGVGIALGALGLFLVLVGLSRIAAWGLVTPFPAAPFTVLGISPALPSVLAGVAVLAVLVAVEPGVERRHGIALLPRSFIANRQVLAGLYANLVAFFFVGLQGILTGPYLQLVAGWTATQVAAATVCFGVPVLVFSVWIPYRAPHADARRVLQLGYAVMAVALALRCLAISEHGVVAALVIVGEALSGAGVGIVNSQANSVVAEALDERDAAQSGGVQATARNVGQALGVGILGAVLLFGITSSVDASVHESTAVSDRTADAVSRRELSLMGDEAFAKTIADIPMARSERSALMRINARDRFWVTRIAYLVAAGICLLGLVTTPWVTARARSGLRNKEVRS